MKSLTLLRREGAQAALKAHARVKGARPRGAALLSLDTNPDLQSDAVDLIADLLLHANTDLGLDPLDIISAAMSHVPALGAAHAALQPLRAERYVVKATAPDGAVSWVSWNAPGLSPHREQGMRYVSQEVAARVAHAARHGEPDAFWNSERESAALTRKLREGWTFTPEPA